MRAVRYCLGAMLVSLAFVSMPSQAAEPDTSNLVDGVSFEVGVGEHVQLYRVGFQWDWNKDWFRTAGGYHLNGYWDLNVGWWHGSRYNDGHESQNLGVIGITPVFRWENASKKGPDVEAGIGASFFSENYNNNGNKMGTSFEFADHIGVGYVFNNNFDLGLRVQHYSNAGISKPNDGENFIVLRGAYRF